MIGILDESGTAPGPSRARGFSVPVFREGGWLEAGLALEHRPQQERMARSAAGAFEDDRCLLAEAGTGVGKSLAYLIPGLIHAVDRGRQMIVSTHTISLQEQIETKDLPLCRRLFSLRPELGRYAAFRSAVLLGKANYLCTTRLAHALADHQTLLPDDGYAELQRIARWAEGSSQGIRHEMDPAPRADVWELVNGDSSGCARKYCDCERCFHQRARARLRGAQVIIVNHALLFALLAAGGNQSGEAQSRGILFPEDFLVLDEAHTVPAVATDHFGLSISSHGIERTLRHLYQPRTRRGLLRRHGDARSHALVEEAVEAFRRFFAGIEQSMLSARPIVRLREARPVFPEIEAPLEGLAQALGKAADRLEDGSGRDELLEQRARIRGLQAGLLEWQTLGDENQVYWAERGGSRGTIVGLRSAPIDVAPELRARIFASGVGVVCTSATLAIGGEMGPFAARIGAEGADSVVLTSPFDFERNTRVFVAADVPAPSPRDASLALDVLADYIGYCTGRVRGGSLVLFTSYADMRTVAALLEERFRTQGRPFLVQGGGLGRTELARRMRSLGNLVLFGTDSFWTGVDVPGDALAQVVITRLPFDPPDHPVLEAQSDRIRDAGGSPFGELTLPDAVVRFRQGVGRLIRNKTDRGIVTILDSRVLGKAYGRVFMGGLPKEEFVAITRENRDSEFLPYP
jgi:ATP-dependent DNA helicase DinG